MVQGFHHWHGGFAVKERLTEGAGFYFLKMRRQTEIWKIQEKAN